MKRKVIQIADSTQLVSLPRKWALANGVRKGDELDVQMHDDRLTISCKPDSAVERASIKINDYGILSSRLIYALYKKGVDEIKISFDNPNNMSIVQNALHQETVGYEIVEQDSKSCLIKNISSNIMGFDTMVRRTFLLLLTLAEETHKLLPKNDLDGLKNLLPLEASNNRFTTLCRRYLNKFGGPERKKVGPYYCVIEELEKIADEYKYLIRAIEHQNPKSEVKLSKEITDAYKKLHEMMKDFYESFYKFDAKKIARMGEMRKEFIKKWYNQMGKMKNPIEFTLMHHAVVIMQKVFNLLGPLLILKSTSDRLVSEPHRQN